MKALSVLVLALMSATAAASGSKPSSMVRLLAAPESLDGRAVITVGYLRSEEPGVAIYLHKEDADKRLTLNAVWLSGITCKRRSGDPFKYGYVLVEATVVADKHGPNDVFAAELIKPRRCEAWPIEMPPVASNNSFKPNPLRGSA